MSLNTNWAFLLAFTVALALPAAASAQLFKSSQKVDTTQQEEEVEKPSLKAWLFGNKQERKGLKADHQEAKDDVRAARKERKAAEARERAAKARADAIKADRRAARAEKKAKKAEAKADKAKDQADGEHQNWLERLFAQQ